MAAKERDAYLFLALLQARTGASLTHRLEGRPVTDVLERPLEEVVAGLHLTQRGSRALQELRPGFDAGELRRTLACRDIDVHTLADGAYPGRLREAPDPPPALFASGKLSDGPSVALVGSRKASRAGMESARLLARELAIRGVGVVSGLALGVDAAAHEGALAGGGHTVGVLGCGIDVVYPRANRGLFERVKSRGAVVSEYSLGEAPLAWRFPARNRIVAGLCDAVVVVEAPEKSGALITARHALDAGRDVWAFPGPADAPECRGSNRLLADGAGVIWDVPEFVAAVTDGAPSGRGVMARVEATREETPEPPVGPPAELPEDEARVLSGVGFRAAGADVVAGCAGVEMRRVLSALALLELKGYVARDGAGNFVRRTAL